MRLSKKKATAIALILLMTSIALTATSAFGQVAPLPGVTNWHDGSSMPLPAGVTADQTFATVAHLSFRPNPVGLGQPLLVNMWMQPPIQVTNYFKNAFTVTFTKPDGKTETIGPLSSFQGDATAWFEQVVDQVGTWKLKFDFAGAYFPAGNYTTRAGQFSGTLGIDRNAEFPLSVYYKPSSDGPYEFVVQEQLVASWPPSALPTDYWTRPISPENREWWIIAGNYPATGIVGGGSNWPANTNTYMSNYGYIPYVQAPNTAHVVWKRQNAISGLIGGTMGQMSLTSGGGNPSLIYAGRGYQTLTKIVDGKPTSVWQCYNIRTGEVYWERTDLTQVPTMISYVTSTVQLVPGTEASPTGMSVSLLYVGGGRLIKYDPWIGNINLNISIAPLTTGTMYAPDRFLSVQNIGNTSKPNYRLIEWNVTGYVPIGTSTITIGILNNVSFPFSSIGTADYESMIAVSTQSIRSVPASGVPASWEATAAVNGAVSYSQRLMGVSLRTGQLLWNITTDESLGTQGFFSGSTAVADHGKYAVRLNDGKFHCWDLNSGKELWQSEISSWPWGNFGIYGINSYGGMIIYAQYDGVVAYNWNDGKIAWRYKYTAEYPYETPYQDNYPFYDSNVRIADGKVYASNTEHTTSQPITRGWSMHCINVTTGEGVWNLTGAMSPGAVADGYLTASNSYDGYMYVFGKGQTKTTVTAPDVVVPKGTGVVIKGTILDQSPAQPNTPCVSKDSMSTQMEYIHLQHPVDGVGHNIQMTGVLGTLAAIDSSGSYVNIGTVTTSAYYGTYEMVWTPSNEGTYKIIASFAGDDSYGSSAASTAISVGPSSEARNIPEQIVPIDYTMT
ncbi:MAG: PQQ-binding-like beta-propeller repeat protein, partial [Chloroflexota bacterium]